MAEEAETKMESLKVDEKPVEKKEDGVEEDIVDPWNVSTSSATGIDYEKLLGRFMV